MRPKMNSWSAAQSEALALCDCCDATMGDGAAPGQVYVAASRNSQTRSTLPSRPSARPYRKGFVFRRLKPNDSSRWLQHPIHETILWARLQRGAVDEAHHRRLFCLLQSGPEESKAQKCNNQLRVARWPDNRRSLDHCPVHGPRFGDVAAAVLVASNWPAAQAERENGRQVAR